MSKYKIVWASSTVFKCASCQTWIIRFPDFMGEPFDKGWECENCGCTSVTFQNGRPFGIKSKEMESFQAEWDESENSFIEWISEAELQDTIKTIPPFVPVP